MSPSRPWAPERGLSEPLLAEFPLHGHSGEQVIAVTYCDFTTGPRGERLSPEERIAEILSRYEPGSAVHRAVQASAPQLLDQCREVTAALTISRGTRASGVLRFLRARGIAAVVTTGQEALFVAGPVLPAAVEELDLDRFRGEVGCGPFLGGRALHGLPRRDQPMNSASLAWPSPVGMGIGRETS
jgi:hypothetical protein